MFDLTNQVVVVTGAAGNLGIAVSRAFQTAGAQLVLVDRAPDRLQQIFTDIADSPNHMLANSVDLTEVKASEGYPRCRF